MRHLYGGAAPLAAGISPLSYDGHPPVILSPALPSRSHPHTALGSVLNVKLPKLSIRQYNRDLTRWVTFWDAFNSSVHSNPTLFPVDKFNCLVSLLESSAAEAIAGLVITAANYNEAISILKRRFGNPQLIVSRHMETLLGIGTVSLHHDNRGLRKLYDFVEAHVRGFRAL